MNEMLLKLFLAVLVGGLIGAEREYHTGMGLRTMMLICLGSTLFTIYSRLFAVGEGDPRRIAAAIVTGVGFLGAGMVWRYRSGVMGLTTAATVWLVAALGMGIGLGYYLVVTVATALVLAVLWAVPRWQQLTQASQSYTYEITCSANNTVYNDTIYLLEGNGLRITRATMAKEGDKLIYIWTAHGKPENHRATMSALLANPDIHDFHVG